MQTLESLRRSIDSVQDMQSVVTTMKTLAAVSIRQYEAAVEALVDYDNTIEMAFRILFRDHDLRSLQRDEPIGAWGAIVLGSDQGMCGQFNEDITSLASEFMRKHHEREWSLLTVGVRARNRMQDAGHDVDKNYSLPVSVADITRLVQELLPHIQQWQSSLHLGRLIVFYNQKTSAASYQPHRTQLLPIAHRRIVAWKQQPWTSRSLPVYSMPRRKLFSAVMREYLFVAIFRACAESLASENVSRIASMQAAEKNIDERLSELQTRFHQQRQTSITEELLDVVTGFEALSKK